MQPQFKPPLWRRLLSLASDINTLLWLWGLVAGLSLVVRYQRWTMTPASIIFVIKDVAIILGCVATISTAVKTVQWYVPKYKLWRDPPRIVVIPTGGMQAAIQITHYGQPATWEVRMRIAKSLDRNIYSPAPLWRRSAIEKDGKKYYAATLKNREKAHVVFANMLNGKILLEYADPSFVFLRKNKAIIEIEIKSSIDLIRKCYEINVNRNLLAMSLEEISCEKVIEAE